MPRTLRSRRLDGQDGPSCTAYTMDVLEPKDHGEALARFRSEVIGALTRMELPRGQLAARLHARSEQRFRPPGATATRTFVVPTLERWYRRYKCGGLAALRPEERADKGAARASPSSSSTSHRAVHHRHAAPQLVVVALAQPALAATHRALDSAHPLLAPDSSPSPPLLDDKEHCAHPRRPRRKRPRSPPRRLRPPHPRRQR